MGTASAKTRNPLCKSGFYVISYRNPRNMRQIGDFVELPAGHTATCIDDCRYIWTGGPARRNDLAYLGPFTAGARGDGRPIWVTDLRNPARPRVFGQPIDLWRNDSLTDYSHDVNVDDRGIAWVSGRGGIRGYATEGRWRDPLMNITREAEPWDPILVAGGGMAGGEDGVAQPQTGFMHNSLRPVDGSTQADGVRRGNVLIGTEEDFTTPCNKSGRVVLSDITGSLGGEPAANSTPESPYRMAALDSFHPTDTGEAVDPEPGLLGPLLRAQRLHAGGGLVRAGPAAARRVRCSRGAPDRLLPRDRDRRDNEPELELLGPRLEGALCLPVRHGPRHRDPQAPALDRGGGADAQRDRAQRSA